MEKYERVGSFELSTYGKPRCRITWRLPDEGVWICVGGESIQLTDEKHIRALTSAMMHLQGDFEAAGVDANEPVEDWP